MLQTCLLLLGFTISVQSFDPQFTLDPAIPTVAPETHNNSDVCAGHCSLAFLEEIKSELGAEQALSLMNLNYNEFLKAFSNTTFFESFCDIYHKFQQCSSQCESGNLVQLMSRTSEMIDNYCVYNRAAIQEKFPCLAGIAPQPECIRTCTSHHDAVTSLADSFRTLVTKQDTAVTEKYLGESCEYVICTLHCDVPAIAHNCDFDTANLVIKLTKKSFESMQSLALDMGVVKTWPKMCEDINTYRLPQPSTAPSTNDVIAEAPVVAAEAPTSAPQQAAVTANSVSLALCSLPFLISALFHF